MRLIIAATLILVAVETVVVISIMRNVASEDWP